MKKLPVRALADGDLKQRDDFMNCKWKRRVCYGVLLFGLLAIVKTDLKAQSANRIWKPAVYHGLVMGKANRKELFRLLGKPKAVATPEGQRETDKHKELWYYFDLHGKWNGKLVAYVAQRTGIVVGISLEPEKCTKEQVLDLLGGDYVEMRYEFCDCDDDEDSAPVFESPRGQFLHMEYRAKGVSVYFHDGTARIDYSSERYELANQTECKKACQRF